MTVDVAFRCEAWRSRRHRLRAQPDRRRSHGSAGLGHPAHSLAPRHLCPAEHLVHQGDVGPDRPGCAVVVAELHLLADQLPQIGAVVLGAHRLAARPVDGERRCRCDLHGPDAEPDVVVLVDRVVVVGRVGVKDDLLALRGSARGDLRERRRADRRSRRCG